VPSTLSALHVTNGDIVAEELGRTSLGGTALSWQDVLHEGPLADVPPAELRTLRAGFLAGNGWGDEGDLLAGLEARDEQLERAVREGGPIVLWFEHDLFDQLQLLQVLAALGGAAPGQVELVQADDYLGTLDAERLEALWERRAPLSAETLKVGGAAWRDVCRGDLDVALERDTSALPHLASALRRLREERAPLSRTKRQLLEALRGGPRRPVEVFLASQAAEEALFLGDSWAFLYLYELGQEGLVTPLPAPPPRGDHDQFTSVSVELTPAGRALVATPT
jgi:hypothetical protein